MWLWTAKHEDSPLIKKLLQIHDELQATVGLQKEQQTVFKLGLLKRVGGSTMPRTSFASIVARRRE